MLVLQIVHGTFDRLLRRPGTKSLLWCFCITLLSIRFFLVCHEGLFKLKLIDVEYLVIPPHLILVLAITGTAIREVLWQINTIQQVHLIEGIIDLLPRLHVDFEDRQLLFYLLVCYNWGQVFFLARDLIDVGLRSLTQVGTLLQVGSVYRGFHLICGGSLLQILWAHLVADENIRIRLLFGHRYLLQRAFPCEALVYFLFQLVSRRQFFRILIGIHFVFDLDLVVKHFIIQIALANSYVAASW